MSQIRERSIKASTIAAPPADGNADDTACTVGAAGQSGDAPQPSDQRREKVTLMLALVSCCPGTIGVEAAESSAAWR